MNPQPALTWNPPFSGGHGLSSTAISVGQYYTEGRKSQMETVTYGYPFIQLRNVFNECSSEGWDGYEELDELYFAHWSLNDAYVFGDGYKKLGWTPDVRIERWLAEQIIDFILKEYPDDYGHFDGKKKLEHFEFENTICRLPTMEEKSRW